VAGRKDRLYLGNVVQMGIGQGELVNVTPIQLARAYASLANGGILYRPRILKEAHLPDGTPLAEGKPEEQGRIPLNERQRAEILEGLRRVINEPGGTAARYNIKPEWRVYGKTGTAQIGGGKTNAWFVGFAPAEAPTILLVVLVEHSPYHGGEMCAPLARQILSYYFGQPEPVLMPAGTQPPKKTGESED
jgi:penicillin-binding protein 2